MSLATPAGVRGVAFSPDGHLLASAGDDASVRLWDLAAGGQTRLLEGHTEWVRAVAFSSDGRLLASAGDDASVRLWDLAMGAQTRLLEGHTGGVRGVAFSPDGRLLASTGYASVRLWDLATGAQTDVLEGHRGGVNGVAFKPRRAPAGQRQRRRIGAAVGPRHGRTDPPPRGPPTRGERGILAAVADKHDRPPGPRPFPALMRPTVHGTHLSRA